MADGEAALTALRKSPESPGAGLGTTDQAVPSQCSTKVSPPPVSA
jgi:hypothetical protein